MHKRMAQVGVWVWACALLLGLPRTTVAAPQAFAFLAGFPRTEFYGASNSSPAIVDLNNDGKLEILIADTNGCVWAWDRQGNVLANFPLKTNGACSYTPRIDGPLAIGDMDGDGTLEIVAGTRGVSNTLGQRGKVFVWRANGAPVAGWPQEMFWSPDPEPSNLAEVYTVALGNVTGDAKLEIVAGTSNNSLSETCGENVYAWQTSGTLVSGFPTKYRGAGIWGYVAVADLTGDGLAEIITGRDQLYLHAYRADGTPLAGWPARTYVDPTKTDYDADKYMEYTTGAPAIGDLDGDGTPEIVIAGRVRDPLQGHTWTQNGLLVLEPNGSRRAGWTLIKLAGAPLYDLIPSKQAVALADLDADGKLEIVVPFADGTVRAYRENGTQAWTYNYAQGRHLFASEPVIGDVTGDSKADVVFGTYSPDATANAYVSVIGLDSNGNPLANFPLALPNEKASQELHGIRGGLALGDLNGDGTVEIAAASFGGALYVWTTGVAYQPSTMKWQMSRHDLYRSGSVTGGLHKPAVSLARALSATTYTYLPLITRAGGQTTTGCF